MSNLVLLDSCSEDLCVLIEKEDMSYTFIYDIIDDIQIQMSITPSKHPIPYTYEITDNVARGVDVISLKGIMGCLSQCGNSDFGRTDVSMREVIIAMKNMQDRTLYDRDGYATLTSNHWKANHMLLTNVVIGQSQEHVQKLDISTTWTAAHLVGTITSPEFKIGGIDFRRNTEVDNTIP